MFFSEAAPTGFGPGNQISFVKRCRRQMRGLENADGLVLVGVRVFFLFKGHQEKDQGRQKSHTHVKGQNTRHVEP